MRENESRLFTLRPEPNERNGTTAIRPNRRDHHLFKKPVNRSIHGPFRKWILPLASEVNPLKDAADWYSE